MDRLLGRGGGGIDDFALLVPAAETLGWLDPLFNRPVASEPKVRGAGRSAVDATGRVVDPAVRARGAAEVPPILADDAVAVAKDVVAGRLDETPAFC